MRGLAVLLVVLSHAAHKKLYALPGLDFAGIGKAGVFLFFVLSAFLLTRVFLRLRVPALGELRVWANYAVRRILRIFPLFGLVLLLSWLVTANQERLGWPFAVPFSLSGREALDHLRLDAGKSVLWSIPVEFKYYLFLPFVALALRLARHPLAAGILAALLVAAAGLIWPAAESAQNTIVLGPYLPLFFLGAYAALVHEWLAVRVLPRWARRLAEIAGWLALAAILATIPALYAFIDPDAGRWQPRAFLFHAVIWCILVLAVLHGTGALRAWLGTWPMRALGWISFSVYLWHMAVLALVGRHFGLQGVAGFWVALTLVLAVSAVSYLLVERPCMKVRLPRAAKASPVPQVP